MEHSSESNQGEESERRTAIRAVLSFVFVLLALLVGAGAMIAFILNKVKPTQEETVDLTPTVEVSPIAFTKHEVVIETQGVIESAREVSLAAEVGGLVVAIHPQLIQGGAVEAGDELVTIAAADYEAAVERAKSALADAELALEQERARAKQAERDWEKLGRGAASDLVLRVPNIKSAKARVSSAGAELARAERDLTRTVIKAPFSGRIRMADVEVGAVVAPGSRVAALYSDKLLEVRLPFPLRDFGFLQESARSRKDPMEFTLTATIGADEKVWSARLDRIEGEIERSTLSGYGIARVNPPEEGKAGYPPVGLFVNAKVPGGRLENVVVIPRSVVRGRDEVWVVNGDRLKKRQVEILRSGRETLVTRGDFLPSDLLVVTRLEAPVPGAKVIPKTAAELAPEQGPAANETAEATN